MKSLYKIRVEWLVAGKGGEYESSSMNVVADCGAVAIIAAMRQTREAFVEQLSDVRVQEIVLVANVDLVA